MGQAFYSLAVGAASMITYGAYLNRNENIAANSVMIASTDTLVALVAGLMIFPVVFAFSLDPGAAWGSSSTPCRRFFAGMPGGSLIGAAFFFLAFIAALTTSISMLWITVAFVEEWLGWSRPLTVAMLGGVAWAGGAASVSIDGMAALLDFLAGNVFLPLGGLLVAIFAGWVVPRAVMRDELHQSSEGIFRFWRFMIRYVSPIAVGLIFVFGIAAQL